MTNIPKIPITRHHDMLAKVRPVEHWIPVDTNYVIPNRFRDNLDSFEKFSVYKENINFLILRANLMKENALNLMLYKFERILEVLESHPDFAKFFKKPPETDTKKKESLDMLKPYGILKSDLIDDLGSIIRELSGFVTTLWQYVELDQITTRKIQDFVLSKPTQKDKSI